MMRLPRTSVIAALSLLASAATAHAQCAWVLWNGGYASGETDLVKWARWDSFDTRRDCVRFLNTEEAKLKGAGRAGLRVSETILDETGAHGASWQCLPDTVDPHGLRGKD